MTDEVNTRNDDSETPFVLRPGTAGKSSTAIAALGASGDVEEVFRAKFASWVGGSSDPDPVRRFPLRALAPDAADFLVEAGHLSHRDIRFLVERQGFDVDPRDTVAFYDALLDLTEAHPWMLAVLDAQVASHRIGTKNGRKPARNEREKTWNTLEKLVIGKLRLRHNPELEQRLGEFVARESVPTDLWVAAFCEYALDHYFQMLKNDPAEFDLACALATGDRSFQYALDQVIDTGEKTKDWRPAASLALMQIDICRKHGIQVPDTTLRAVTNILSGLAWNLDPKEPATFQLLSDLAGQAARIAETQISSEADALAARLAALGFDIDTADLNPVRTSVFEDDYVDILISEMENSQAGLPCLLAREKEIEEEIVNATREKKFERLRELADEAEKITHEIRKEATLRETLTEIVTCTLKDDVDAVWGLLRIPSPENRDDDDLPTLSPADTPDARKRDAHSISDEAELVTGEGDAAHSPEENATDGPRLDIDDTPRAGISVPREASAATVLTPEGEDEQETSSDDPVPEDDASVAEEALDEPEPVPPLVEDSEPQDEGEAEPIDPETFEPETVADIISADDTEPSIGSDVLTDLLSRGLLGLCTDAADALEESRENWPIEAVALRAAAASRARLAGYGPETSQFLVVANRAVGGTRSNLGSCLLLGALLRPVVSQQAFMPLRPGMPDLARGALGSHLIDVASAVSELGYDFPPDPDMLARISGAQQVPKKERIARKLSEWSELTLRKSSRWHFATSFLQSVLSDSGLIGKARAAIESGSRNAIALAHAAMEELDSTSAIQTRADDYATASGRPLAKLHPRGVEYLQRHFNEAFALLSEWVAAAEAEGQGADRSEYRLRSVVGRLVGHLERARTGLRTHSSASSLELAVARLVAARIDEAIEALRGADTGDFPTVESALTVERDLLPGIDGPVATDPSARLQRLIEVFSTAGVPKPQEALENALHRGAFETAERISLRYGFDATDRIATESRAYVANWLEGIRMREQRMKRLQKVDYTQQEEIARWLGWCKVTDDRLSSDAAEPELDDLDDISNQARELDRVADGIAENIRRDQDERIRKHRNEGNAADADALLATRDELTLEAIEDRIAQLRDDRSAATVDADLEGLGTSFTPRFVEAAAGKDWPRTMADYERALAEDGPLRTEEDRRAAALEFIGLHREISTGIPKGPPAKAKVIALFEEAGFENVKLNEAVSVGRARGWQMTMTADIRSDGWFLPPIFGSKAKDGYKLFLVGADVLPETIVKAASSDRPVILFLAGVADLARRHEFATRLRAAAIPALLVDEALTVFAAIHRETRARTIFECGLPYGRVEPYTTDAGQIPPEMFFGRREEIRDIMSRTANGCLVYGGRQLGKSALLSHVARIHHDPAANRVVVRREARNLGKEAEPAANIWTYLNTMLATHGVVRPASLTAEDVSRDIRNWIQTRQNAQVVCLFDETDNFLAADTRNDYPELGRLKELMEDTGRAFKVVFAGLHNVQRMHRQPNSPLAHLGRPICIGPLNRTEDDKREAHDLVILPMRAAGFRFETTEAVEDILAWANYYPSLVQEFAKGLIGMLHGAGSGQSYRLADSGPLWTIPTKDLFEHRGFPAIEERVRTKFHWTLDLDPRYALVAYTLAGLAADGYEQQALVSGFRASDLLDYAMISWPRNAERPSTAAFDAILEELFDLGVLGRVRIPGTQRFTYCLRTRQVAAMLGSREDIDHALKDLEAKDPPVEIDRTTHRRRYAAENRSISMSDKELPYSPLTDFQIERLLAKDRTGARLVCGLEVLGLSKVATALKWVSENSQLPGASKGSIEVIVATGQKDIGNIVSKPARSDSRRRVVIYRPETAVTAKEVLDWLEQRPVVLDGRVVPILLLDAADAGMRALAIRRGEQAEFLSAWGAEMVRVHLSNIERTDIDTSALREKILAVTGGIPADVVKLVNALIKAGDHGAVFAGWEPSLRASDEIARGPLGTVLVSLEDTEDPGDYCALNDLLREVTGADLVTHGPDLVATGLLSDWSNSATRLRRSALGRLLANRMEGQTMA